MGCCPLLARARARPCGNQSGIVFTPSPFTLLRPPRVPRRRYRKTFALNDSYAGQRVSLIFDGVYRASDMWINGIVRRCLPRAFGVR